MTTHRDPIVVALSEALREIAARRARETDERRATMALVGNKRGGKAA